MKIERIIYGIIILVLLGVIIYGFSIKSEKDSLTYAMYLDLELLNIREDYTMKASDYYDLASDAYIGEDYQGVIENCENAREHFSIEGQRFNNLKAEIEMRGEDRLNRHYVDLLEQKIIISYDLYEACEYFESAAKYYDIYYNGNVPINDNSFDMGGNAIGSMNEKIVHHDNAVEEHNVILGHITAELESLL